MSATELFLYWNQDSTTLKIIAAATVIYVLGRLLGLWKKPGNYPPGPIGLPVVGYLPFLTDKPHEKFEKLREKYGNIFSLNLGRHYTVVLCDVDSMRDAFNKDEFLGRPDHNVLAPSVFKQNISMVNGKDWQEQRKLIFHALKGAGQGSEFVEQVVNDEIRRFLQRTGKANGKPFDIKDSLSTGVSNIITRLAFGKAYESDSESRAFLNQCIQEMVEHMSQVAVQNFFPWLAEIPLMNKYQGWDKYQKLMRKLKDFFEKEIDEHEKTLDPHNIRDFIDTCLVQEMKAKEQGQRTSLSRNVLCGNMLTLLGAGSETVRTSLQWLFFALVNYPGVQSKIQKEIDEVLGREREPSWSDQKDMPYTMSVIMEVQRLFTIVPLNIIHYTLEDTKLGGYDIPKGTRIITNLWSVMRDPAQWQKPGEFVPERFLDESQRNISRHKSYLPFSFGKRNCPGDSLSYIEMFLFVTATLQKYDVQLPKGKTINFEAEFYVTSQPESQDLCFIERN